MAAGVASPETAAEPDAARGALYPRLSLTAGGGTASENFTDLLDGDFRVWTLAGNLVLKLARWHTKELTTRTHASINA